MVKYTSDTRGSKGSGAFSFAQDTQLPRKLQERVLQFGKACVMGSLTADKNDVDAGMKSLLVEAVSLAEPSLHAVAPMRLAELRADGNADSVSFLSVSTAIDRYHRMGSGLSSAV